jgi:hypothetical protein
LRVILDMHAASRDTGVGFALIQGSSGTQRLFDVTGTAAVLAFVEPSELDGGGL